MVDDLPHLGSICIVGVGSTGTAVLSYCIELLQDSEPRVDSISVYPGDAMAPEVDLDPRISIYPAGQPIDGTYDLTIISPGIPLHSELYRSAQRCSQEVISEPEFAFRESPRRWAAVTGTNGKTTTTALLTHLLNQGNIKARSCGNIGTPCIEAIRQREDDEWLVVELSSYQLASTSQLAPEVAILLNITPDHIAWHGSYTEYVKAKQALFSCMAPDAPLIVDATNAETARILQEIEQSGMRVIALGGSSGLDEDTTKSCTPREAAFLQGEDSLLTVVLDDVCHVLVPATELQIKGEHNQLNALAAATAALSIGVDSQALRVGLRSFMPLEHRIEPCGVIAGRAFYNDSKATNPEATIKALSAFMDQPVILMLGGRDKGTDLSDLVSSCKRSCRAVICYGESRERFFSEFQAAQCDGQPGFRLLKVESFRQAFKVACESAQPGDAVLLSPACASFDEFNCFEQRGEVFKSLVEEWGSSDGQGE